MTSQQIMDKVSAVQQAASDCAIHQDRNPRVIIQNHELNPGDVVRQGDVYIQRISFQEFKSNSSMYKPSESITSRQLANGTDVGSRHTIEGNFNFQAVVKEDPFVNEKGARYPVGRFEAVDAFNFDHPEHQNFELPAGYYEVSIQADTLTKSRVLD